MASDPSQSDALDRQTKEPAKPGDLSNTLKQSNSASDGFTTGWRFFLYLMGGWSVQLIFCFSYPPTDTPLLNVILSGLHSFCILWFVGSGGYFLGVLAGFLFGFPKAKFDKSERSQKDSSQETISLKISAIRDNTNLEDISDWLTKIIVGLGLINFLPFLDGIDKFGTYIGNAVKQGSSDITGGYVIAIASSLYGFACGFIFFYVWARGEWARILNRTSAT